MNHLSQRWRQFTEHWQSLSARTRLLAGALVVMVTLGIAALTMQQNTGEWVTLFEGRGLSHGELDRMEAAFSTAGLSDWQREGSHIRVPSSEKYTFMAALAEKKVLPENSDEVFFETMQSSKFYESSQQRALRIKYATQREAGMIVQSMTGIESATVRYSDVAGQGFGSPKTTKINVAVRTTDQHSLTAEQIAAICDTVASTIGADVKDVVVTDLIAAKAHRGDELVRLDQQSRQRTQAQHEWEAIYQRQIAEILAMIDGVIVNVDVTLQPENTAATTETSKLTNTDSTNTLAVTDEQGHAAATTPEPTLLQHGGAISVTPQASPASQTNSLEQHGEQSIDHEQLRSPSSPSSWKIARVTALVSIPKSHFYRIWHQRHQPSGLTANPNLLATQEDLAEIEANISANVQQLVTSCLPAPAVHAQEDQAVMVTSHFDVSAQQATSLPQPTWQAFLTSRWREATALIGMLVVLATVLLTIRTAKSSRATPSPTPSATAPVPTQREAPEETASSHVTDSLRGELTNRVRQDPGKTVDTLKHWIRDAA